MDIQGIDRAIKEAKLWIQQNTPPKEKEYWVDANGILREVPAGMYFDARGDSLKFKKGG